MIHAMLDLETMGSTPGCAILSVGLLFFDPQTGIVTDSHYWELRPNGRIQWDTVHWWTKQTTKPPMEGQWNPDEVQDALRKLWFAHPAEAIWANGANADFGWLRAAMLVPWDFRQERCLRTVAALYPDVPRPPDQHSHNALQDCIWQAKLLHNIYKETGWNT